MEKQYEFKFSASAVGYILALLNKRPREESNEFYLAIERAIKEQDEETEKGFSDSQMIPEEMRAAKQLQGNGAVRDPAGG
jgi:hypothetical protein